MARHELYDEDGNATGERCSQCGGDSFLADHGDRLHCGRCGHTVEKDE